MIRSLFAVLVVALGSVSAVRAGERVELVLRSEATVNGAWVTLADVAELDAIHRVDPDLADRLARVRLAAVRAGAGTLLLQQRDIATAARYASRGRLGKVSIADGSAVVRVTPQLRTVAASSLVDLAVTQFLARCDEVAERCTAAVDASAVRPLDVPAGNLVLDAVLPPRWLDRPGTLDVKVRVIVDDVVVGAARVPVTWRAVREAWVLESAAEPRAALRRKDVRSVRIDAGDVSASALAFDPRSRVLRATDAIDRGTAVPTYGRQMLAEFRTGDEVPVSVALGNVRVTRKGVAVQDGRPGARAFVRFEGADLVSGQVPLPKSDSDTERSQR